MIQMSIHAEWTSARDRLSAAVTSLGFPPEFGEVMARQLGSPKAINRMTSYVYQAKPRTEEMLIDEMLAICAEIDTWKAKRPARKRRQSITLICLTDDEEEQ